MTSTTTHGRRPRNGWRSAALHGRRVEGDEGVEVTLTAHRWDRQLLFLGLHAETAREKVLHLGRDAPLERHLQQHAITELSLIHI